MRKYQDVCTRRTRRTCIAAHVTAPVCVAKESSTSFHHALSCIDTMLGIAPATQQGDDSSIYNGSYYGVWEITSIPLL